MFGTIQQHSDQKHKGSTNYEVGEEVPMNQTSAQKQTEGTHDDAISTTGVKAVDMKLEVIVIPVSDAERAEQFYRKLGWRQDVTPPGSGVFQFTPHGSACSVQFGKASPRPHPAQPRKII